MVNKTDFKNIINWLPPRKNGRDINKSTFGHVMIFAGSRGYSGAAILAAEAAQRAGAGLVTLIIPEGLELAVVSRISPTIMTQTLPQSSDFSFGVHALEAALALAKNASAVVLGPGIGLGDEVAKFVHDFVSRCSAPLVIDADALHLLAKESDHGHSIVKARQCSTILTPHPGEMARLLGMTTEAVQNDRVAAIQQAVKLYNCVVLLKGSDTLIANPSGQLFINTTGNSGMATGGSGDVLTGVIAALLAQHLLAFEAATAGAFIHGTSGDLVAHSNGSPIGLTATDLISYLPKAFATCYKN